MTVINEDTRLDIAALVEVELTTRCIAGEYDDRHKQCDHHVDALTAVDVLIGAGWRPGVAQLEEELADLRDRIFRVTLDRDTLRRKLRETPA